MTGNLNHERINSQVKGLQFMTVPSSRLNLQENCIVLFVCHGCQLMKVEGQGWKQSQKEAVVETWKYTPEESGLGNSMGTSHKEGSRFYHGNRRGFILQDQQHTATRFLDFNISTFPQIPQIPQMPQTAPVPLTQTPSLGRQRMCLKHPGILDRC